MTEEETIDQLTKAKLIQEEVLRLKSRLSNLMLDLQMVPHYGIFVSDIERSSNERVANLRIQLCQIRGE
jgi:hypothetical protein